MTGCEWLGWKLTASSCLRILSYHGVCDDSLAGEAWVPKHFVTRSAFERQLIYLRKHTTPVSLSEAVAKLRNGTIPDRAVVLTFDDGYANNLHHVLPLLKKYDVPATIFVSTSYVESGELFPFDKLRLIKLMKQNYSGDLKLLPNYKRCRLDEVRSVLETIWPAAESSLTDHQFETLRPLCREEFDRLNCDLVSIGAHSHMHCILRNESRDRRADEIATSVSLIRQWTGKDECLFSYPNGQQDDYDEMDKQELRRLRVSVAVNGVSGINRFGSDPLDLKRLPVGIYHDGYAYAAEVLGLRHLLQTVTFR